MIPIAASLNVQVPSLNPTIANPLDYIRVLVNEKYEFDCRDFELYSFQRLYSTKSFLSSATRIFVRVAYMPVIVTTSHTLESNFCRTSYFFVIFNHLVKSTCP